MKLVSVKPSKKPEKKLDAVFETDSGRTKTVAFGAKGMDDYTKTHDTDQRARYLKRHAANENWNKHDSAGALSRWILWGESTSLLKNIANYKNKVNN
jgi:hypothetical protein